MRNEAITAIKEGDVLSYHYDTGTFGYTTAYVRVLKVCPRKLRVRFETGAVALKYPDYFDRIVPPATVAELQAEGVRI
jgi:hypothetical protein